MLAQDSRLVPGSRILWTDRIPTTVFSRPFEAAIGGQSFSATLVLQFWQSKLAVIMVYWPLNAFASVSAWRVAADELYNQLKATYAFDLVREHYPPFRGAPHMTMQDSSGNRLEMFASGERFTISLVYLWNSYAQALDMAPTPRRSY
ncbi:MAG: hypothetical protein L0Z46_12900 [Nitrospiraceae bacterium]|nr:hypothetical protein [Nitrospiraceae bacterium]